MTRSLQVRDMQRSVVRFSTASSVIADHATFRHLVQACVKSAWNTLMIIETSSNDETPMWTRSEASISVLSHRDDHHERQQFVVRAQEEKIAADSDTTKVFQTRGGIGTVLREQPSTEGAQAKSVFVFANHLTAVQALECTTSEVLRNALVNASCFPVEPKPRSRCGQRSLCRECQSGEGLG